MEPKSQSTAQNDTELAWCQPSPKEQDEGLLILQIQETEVWNIVYWHCLFIIYTHLLSW